MIEKEKRTEILKLAEEYGNKYVAQQYNISARSIRRWKQHARNQRDAFEVEELPTGNLPIDDLIKERINKYKIKHDYMNKTQLINVDININGPIGIAHFGDPHIDDDGTDIELLYKHADIINETEGLFAGNVGDMHNNWIGRLGRLYGQQSTSANDAWRLVEHFIGKVNWLYLVGGNHDAWTGAGDPLDWMVSYGGGVFANWGVRMNLKFPNGKEVRINSRHDFKGHSQWNTAHGLSKAIQMGWRDHILTAGHTHVSGYQVLKDPSTGLISHALRVGSYKTHDRYAIEKGLPDQNIFTCPVTIIDPRYEDDDPRLITTFFDPEKASLYLTFLRKVSKYA